MRKLEEKIKKLEKQIEALKNQSPKEKTEEWFKLLLDGLEIEINDNKPNSVFYKKDGNVIFELYQGSEKKYFYCNYKLVWSVIERKCKFDYDEIQAFIKDMAEQHLKLGVVTPTLLDPPNFICGN
jgi:hypothetical protein